MRLRVILTEWEKGEIYHDGKLGEREAKLREEKRDEE